MFGIFCIFHQTKGWQATNRLTVFCARDAEIIEVRDGFAQLQAKGNLCINL